MADLAARCQVSDTRNGTQSSPVLTIFFRRHDLSKCVDDDADAHVRSDVWWRMNPDGIWIEVPAVYEPIVQTKFEKNLPCQLREPITTRRTAIEPRFRGYQ